MTMQTSKLIDCISRNGRPTRMSKVRRIGTHLACSSPLSVPVPGTAQDIRVKFASTPQEWGDAFRMVAENYRVRGYQCDGGEFWFTPYHALPGTVVIIACKEARVVATFSLIPDNGVLGLPLESLYAEEVQNLRCEGRRLFETGSLADRNLPLREWLSVFQTMMRLGWQYQVQQRRADTTVITINPRHRAFYTRVHGFVPLGPQRAYSLVDGHPAEAYYLDPTRMRVAAPESYAQIFGEPLPPAALLAPRMPAALIRDFSHKSSQSSRQSVDEMLRGFERCGDPLA